MHHHVEQLQNETLLDGIDSRELRFWHRAIYEERVHLQHGIKLREGDCVVDAGAHIGLFTLFLSERYGDLDLYAVEPVPATYELLSQNCARHVPLARCIPLALAERERRIQLQWFPRFSSWSTRYPDLLELRQAVRNHCKLTNYPLWSALARYTPRTFDLCTASLFEHTQIEVRATTLSALMTRECLNRIDLLKLDVEGSEGQVLRGIAERDWPRIRQVVARTRQSDLSTVVHLLRRHNFHITTDAPPILRGTPYLYVYATRRH